MSLLWIKIDIKSQKCNKPHLWAGKWFAGSAEFSLDLILFCFCNGDMKSFWPEPETGLDCKTFNGFRFRWTQWFLDVSLWIQQLDGDDLETQTWVVFLISKWWSISLCLYRLNTFWTKCFDSEKSKYYYYYYCCYSDEYIRWPKRQTSCWVFPCLSLGCFWCLLDAS